MSREGKKHTQYAPQAAGVLLSNPEHWRMDDEVLPTEERAMNIADTALNPEQALIAKEETELEAGRRRFTF